MCIVLVSSLTNSHKNQSFDKRTLFICLPLLPYTYQIYKNDSVTVILLITRTNTESCGQRKRDYMRREGAWVFSFISCAQYPAEQKLPHEIAAQVRPITCETKLFSFLFSSFQFSSNHWLIETVMNSTFFVLDVIRFLFLKSPRWRAKVCNFFWFHFNLAPILSGSLFVTACFFRIFFLSNTDPVAWNHSNNKQPSIYNHTGACSEKVLFNSFSNNIYVYLVLSINSPPKNIVYIICFSHVIISIITSGRGFLSSLSTPTFLNAT